MHTQRINVHEAKSKLSAVLAKIEETGESVLICRMESRWPSGDLLNV
jgi:antitoxin (DNA-binding transcriptional repressor) of toxin-antitoxin stability system